MTIRQKILLAAATAAAFVFFLSPLFILFAFVRSHVTTVSEAKVFSGGDYQITFLMAGDNYRQRNNEPKVYSIRSDGSGLSLAERSSKGVDAQRKLADSTGVRYMMGFEGDFRSPDETKAILIRDPYLALGYAELYVQRRGVAPQALMWGNFYEFEWLPDNRRLVLVKLRIDEGELGILDTESMMYAPLARGYGLGSISVSTDEAGK